MEDYIDRPRYIDRIRPFVDVPVIKILTGVRRCGKSTLLDMITERISERFPRAPVVRLNLESEAGLALRDPAALLEHLRARLPDRSQRAYVFLDEVQRVPGWEDAVNALRVDWNCDLYLTGSNSTMLAGELATNLAGRYVEFPVLPLVFREFIELHAGTARAPRELFDDYLVLGGFPALKYFGLERSPSIQYLQSVLDTVIVRDVIEHHQVRDVDLFRRLIRYCIGNIGRTFSARSVVRHLKSEGRAVSVDTVLNHLDFCIGAHLIARVPRRDVAGKSILRSDEKYYAVDHGLRTAMGFDNLSDVEIVLENIVHTELRSRGYEVQVGWSGAKEVDFLARRGQEVLYVQVCYLLAGQETMDREFGVLESIPDNHPKLVLSLDPLSRGRSGIRHLNIIDFLLQDPL